MSGALTEKSILIRKAARKAAVRMILEDGDPTILRNAEAYADAVHGLSLEGALEAFLCTAFHLMRYNGHAAEVSQVERALERMIREEGT